MTDKPNAFHTLGLEWCTEGFKGACLVKGKTGPYLANTFTIEFEKEGDLVKPLYKNNVEQALQKNLVVTSLNASEVLVRSIDVPLKKENDIDKVLAFQAEPLIPYPLEEAVLDRQLLHPTPDGTQLTLFCAKKEHIEEHLKKWQALQIEPEVVSCVPVALAFFAKVFAPTEAHQFVLNLGEKETSAVLLKENKVLAAQSFNLGINHLKEAFERDGRAHPFLTLDFSLIKMQEHPALFQALDLYRLEVVRTLYALSKYTKGQEIVQILVTGVGGYLTNLSVSLCHSFNKPLIAPSPQEGFSLNTALLQSFAIPIGSALSALPEGQDEVDFRQGSMAYPHPWKRYTVPLALYLLLSLALSVGTFFATSAYLKYQQDDLKVEFSELLKSMHRPYRAFDNEYTAKLEGQKTVEDKEPRPLASLDQEDLMGALRYIEKDLKSTPDMFPLLPNVPTVSDVFAWLSTHPNVVAKDAKTGQLKPLLQIENFTYTMVKRPEMTKKQEKYQIKVEMEFSSPTPKLAREFHDALISPNAIVDPKGEVKWSTNRGLYRASFFLKDKTVYSSF